MPYNPLLHHRSSIRLVGYDYTQSGSYFVTINSYEKEKRFGEIAEGVVRHSNQGIIAASTLLTLPSTFNRLAIDCWVIMPDHVHMILALSNDSVKCSPSSTKPDGSPHATSSGSLGAIVQHFKSIATRKINAALRTPGSPVWQKNYYEHIIRNESELDEIRQYIAANPLNADADGD